VPRRNGLQRIKDVRHTMRDLSNNKDVKHGIYSLVFE
jgi:hypothetical protein